MNASPADQLPMVYIVFGLPGSGKSYFASRWADLINARYINSDKLRKEMYAHPVYSAPGKESVYMQLVLEMKKAIAAGNNIVLDATFSDSRMRCTFRQETKGKATVRFIEITADEPIIRERLKQQRLFSDADYTVYEKLKEEWNDFDEPHLKLLSTHNNIYDMLDQASGYFGITDGAGPPGVWQTP